MKKRFFILLLSGLAALVFLGMAYFRFYVAPWLAEKGLENVILSSLGETVTLERTVIHWLGRPGIEYQGLTIRKAGEQTGWVRIDRVVLRPKLRSLFSKSIRWKSLDLDQPVLRLSGKRGRLPRESLGSMLSLFDRVEINQGEIKWPDREIQELSVSLSNLSTDEPSSLVLKGALKIGDSSAGRVSLRGLVHHASEQGDRSGPEFSAEIKAEGVDPRWFRAGLVRYIPSGLIGSRLTLTAEFEGDLKGGFQLSGTVSLSGSHLVEEMGRLSADFGLTWDGQVLEFQRIRLKAPLIPLEVRGRVYQEEGGEPGVTFQVDCPWEPIGKGRSALPFLSQKTRSFLELVERGEVTLVSVGFTGPLRSLEFPSDEQSLVHWSGAARFRDVIIPWNGEAIRLKSGSVRLDRGRLVGEVTGCSLGGSDLEIPRLSLSRPFSDRSLDLMVRGRVSLPDIPKWVSMGLIPEAVALPMSDIELLSGTGDVSLRVEKSLGRVAPAVVTGRLVFQDATTRTGHLPGTFEGLKGVVDFSSERLVVRDVQGRWQGSTVSANGSIGGLSSKHPEVDFSLRGLLDLRDLAEIASWEGIREGTRLVLQEIASPSGEGDYALAVKGPLGVPEGMAIRGELSVRDGFTRLWNAYPVRRIRGRISFSRHGISIPELRGTWKNSNVALKVSLARLGRVFVRDLTFSAAFDLQDIATERFDHGLPRTWRGFIEPFDFQEGKALLKVTNRKRNDRDTVEGHIDFQEATVRYLPVFPPVTSLKGTASFDERGLKALNIQGRLDSSPVTIQGELASNPGNRVPELSIQADKADWEEVLSWPWKRGVFHATKGKPFVAVHVQVEQGSFREIPLSNIEASLRLEGDRISFEKVAFASPRGYGLITGWLGFGKDDKLSFEFQPYLVNLEASPILMSFQKPGSKRHLTGLGCASGVIRGRGHDLREIARSLNGEVRLFFKEGWFAHFNVLSKVFSLLDLSQLVRGNFPDLKTGGMGYRTIAGHVALKEGRAWTSDFLLDSESMKISAMGSLDIPSGSLDVRLGFRRIGAGGKVVSKIPFFGEIITNDGGSFLQYYVQVEGTVAEPEVRGIPLESVREGIFGPLKKLFEKPLDWFPFQKHPNFDHYYEDREYRYP